MLGSPETLTFEQNTADEILEKLTTASTTPTQELLSYDNEPRRVATLSIMRASIDAGSFNREIIKPLNKLVRETKYNEADLPLLFESLATVPGRYSLECFSKSIRDVEVTDSELFKDPLYMGLRSCLEGNSQIPSEQLIRVIEMYKAVIPENQYDRRILNLISDSFQRELSKDYNALNDLELGDYLSVIIESLSNWEYMKDSSNLAYEKWMGIFDPSNETIPMSLVENYGQAMMLSLEQWVDFPKAENILWVLIYYPSIKDVFLDLLDSKPELLRIQWVDEQYRRLVEALEEDLNHTPVSENYSRYLGDIPARALEPDEKGEKAVSDKYHFASNGLVAYKQEVDSTMPIPTDISNFLLSHNKEVNRGMYYYIHFIPHDQVHYVGHDAAGEILKMGLWGMQNLLDYLEQYHIPDGTVLIGNTNPRMANVAIKCGFTPLGFNAYEVKKAMHEGAERSVDIVATVGDIKKTLSSPKFIAVQRRINGKYRPEN